MTVGSEWGDSGISALLRRRSFTFLAHLLLGPLTRSELATGILNPPTL